MRLKEVRKRLLAMILIACMVFGSAAAAFADESKSAAADSNMQGQVFENGTGSDDAADQSGSAGTTNPAGAADTAQQNGSADINVAADQSDPAGSSDDSDLSIPAEQDDPADPEQNPGTENEGIKGSGEDGEIPTEEEIPLDEQIKTEEEESAADVKELALPAPANEGTPVLTGEFTDDTKQTYKLTITNPELTGTEYYQAKVWSTANGEDDVKYIDFTSSDELTFTALITISDFNDPGDFTAEVYKKTETEDVFVEKKEFTVPAAQAGAVTVSSINKTEGTADVTIEDVSSESGIQKVRAEVWSKSDKSNLYSYDMTDQGSGKWTVSVSTARHQKIVAKYTARIFVTDGNGFETQVGSVKIDFTGTTGTSAVTTGTSSGKYTVKVTGFTSSEKIKGMKVVAWSGKSGKDDVSEHAMTASADGTQYTMSSYIKDFKNFGTIYAYVYLIREDGTTSLFKKNSFVITAPKAQSVTATAKTATGTFSVNVKGMTNMFKISSVKASVWRRSDKSDLQTFALKASGSDYVLDNGLIIGLGSYSGNYKVRVNVYTKNGPATTLNTATINFPASNGKITTEDRYKGQAGKEQMQYTLKLAGYTTRYGVKSVKFKVWAASNPSVKKTYTAKNGKSGAYYAYIPVTSFKKSGRYKVIATITDNKGNTVSLPEKNIMKVTGSLSGTITKTNSDLTGGKFTVSLKNPAAPSGIKSVSFKIWTKADKSDLYTYEGKLNSDGSYRARVNIKNHGYNIGDFKIQASGVMGNGITSTMATATKTFYAKDYAFVLKPKTGFRLFGINNPSGDNIRFGVWSVSGGQDDLTWYNAAQNGKQWTAEFDLSVFKHAGRFKVHIYSGDTFIKEATFKAETGEAGRTGWFYENGLKFYYKAGKKVTNLTGMVSGPYQICVNRTCNTITVYALDGGNGYIVPVIAFACSTGVPGMETPWGTYYTYGKNRWNELMGPSWGQYVTYVVDGIFIHSVPSNDPYSHHGIAWTEYNKLGSAASHGCIRLCVRDAKWIYDYCAVGTEVKIYDSSYPGPFGKPESIKIGPGQDWDPTDPEL